MGFAGGGFALKSHLGAATKNLGPKYLHINKEIGTMFTGKLVGLRPLVSDTSPDAPSFS